MSQILSKLSIKSLLRIVLALLAIGAVFVFALPRFASYSDVWDQVSGFRSGYLLALLLLGVINLVIPAFMQMAALPGLKLRDALAVDWSTTAVTNTIPGGSAIAVGMTWSMYRSRDLSGADVTRSFIVVGLFDNALKFATPLIAALWLATERPMTAGLWQATLAGLGMLLVLIVASVALFTSGAFSNKLGAFLNWLPLIGKGWSERLNNLQDDSIELLAARWRWLSLATFIGHLNNYLLLLFCLRAVGANSELLSSAAILAAFAFGRLVTALPITPGGLGVMELGLVSTLAAVSSVEEAVLVAAVLLFRFLTFALPILLGAFAWIYWNIAR